MARWYLLLVFPETLSPDANLRSEKIAPGICAQDYGQMGVTRTRRQHGSKNHLKKTASVKKTVGEDRPSQTNKAMYFPI